ncbi:MAG: hypothetical protein FJ110_14280 [Deltaproteobacteria bacterium]|nr:hypothetical protein [Deltaproteobacteria bacterium]
MLYRYFAVLFLLGIILTGNLPFHQPVWAETLVHTTTEVRLLLALRVGQEELQKFLPATWQVAPPPGGPIKDANLFVLFIDPLLFQDPQGKPDVGATNRYTVLAVPAKHMQTGEAATVVVTGGVGSTTASAPGAYKASILGTVKREQTYKGANSEGGIVDDFWEVRDVQGGTMDLRIQYERALPMRTKLDQKIYSAVEPTFYRIYRQDIAMDLVKSIPAGVDHVKNYRFNVAMPKLKSLFNGNEQLVAVIAYPMFVRQIFLP